MNRNDKLAAWLFLSVAGVAAAWLAVLPDRDETDPRDRPLVVVDAGTGRTIGDGTTASPVAAASSAMPADTGTRDTELIAKMAPRASSDFRLLGDLVDAGPREPTPAQAAIAAEFAQLPEIGTSGQAVRVNCVATTCEVTGRAVPGQSRAAIERALQRIDLLERMMGRGLSPGPMAVDDAGPDGAGFVVYLNREV